MKIYPKPFQIDLVFTGNPYWLWLVKANIMLLNTVLTNPRIENEQWNINPISRHRWYIAAHMWNISNCKIIIIRSSYNYMSAIYAVCHIWVVRLKFETEFTKSVVFLISTSWWYTRSILSLNLELLRALWRHIHVKTRFNCFAISRNPPICV